MGGEDPLRGDHPVDVVGRRLPADEDDGLALLASQLRRVGVEDDRPRGGAGRGVQALRRDVVGRVRVDPRVEQLVELARVDPRHCFLSRDQALVDHVHRRLQRCRGSPLRAAGLQQEQLAVLDREFDVLHVAVVRLEPLDGLDELGEGVRQPALHGRERLGRADAGDDVLTLRVGQKLAEEAGLAGRRVAREGDPGAGLLALVAEDHLDDVDGGAEVVRNVVVAAVSLGARRVPRVEDGTDGAAELLLRVLREGTAGLLLVHALEGLDQAREIVLLAGQRVGEEVRVDAVDGLAVHLDQAAVGVLREALVARAAGEALGRLVVEADVEDRVHHPGHRDRRARPDGDEQGILGVAEALAGRLLEPGQVLVDLLCQALRKVALLHVGAAGVCSDREAGRHRDAELGHLREADALASEQLASAVGRLVEVVDIAGVSHRGGDFPTEAILRPHGGPDDRPDRWRQVLRRAR